MKIGLFAMSGIRACDKELLELGLTLPGFVERSKIIASLPSLGLLTLAGMTPIEFEVKYHEISDLKNVTELPKDYDLVAISSFSAQISEAYSLAEQYRTLGIPVVIGGLHATVLPNEAAKYCDSVAIGEGELTWPEILKDLEKGSLKQFYDARARSFDLSQAPMPAFELLNIEKYNRLTVQTSRGCPLHCEFCSSSILLSKRYKQKPMENVLMEIDKILDIWKRPFIEFADDNTFVNKKYWKELLPHLKMRQVRWFTETDISIGYDDELLELMQEAGCVEVLIGLESPIQAGLDGIELNSNWKFRHFKNYRKAINNIQGHGIRVNGCFMVGLDEHDVKIFDEIYNFAKELKLFDVQITYPTPFPGTQFYNRLKKEGRLLKENNWEKCTLFDLNFLPKKMTTEELRQGFMKLGKRLYSTEFTSWRRKQFENDFKDYLHKKTKKSVVQSVGNNLVSTECLF